MLVIISDLHLTDGSTGTTISSNAFKLFRNRIQESVYKASIRKTPDGNDDNNEDKFEPIESLDIVLLGDVFDMIRSESWFQDEYVRPWTEIKDNNEYVKVIEKITEAIIEENKESLDVLKGMASDEETKYSIYAPCADCLDQAEIDQIAIGLTPQNGRENWQKVNVNIHYMVGNHDWFYHVSDPRFDKVRRTVVEAMGLSNPSNRPFAWEPQDDDAIDVCMRKHKVYACHGDKYDPYNFTGDRELSSIGDAIVIELISRFPKRLSGEMNGRLPADFVRGLKEIDNVRPIVAVPFWLNGLMEKSISSRPLRRDVKQVWNAMVRDFLDMPYVKSLDKSFELDLTELLGFGLMISQILSFEKLQYLIQGAYKFKPNLASGDGYSRFALKEDRYHSNEAKFVVYGHTHGFEVVPLSTFYSDKDGTNEQLYINSGTWKPVHHITKSDDNKRFVNFAVMSYVVFYQGTERKGRSFEVWNGALDY